MNSNITTGYIPNDQFHNIVKLTQLVSVDLLINNNGKYLLGKRRNKPAQGYLFVPGGKVYNNETICDGLKRVAMDEIGLTDLSDCHPIGLYEHIYEDNYKNNEFGTHYVVCAYEIKTNTEADFSKFSDQHENIVWLTPEEILNSNEVHIFNKYYFQDNPPNLVMRSTLSSLP